MSLFETQVKEARVRGAAPPAPPPQEQSGVGDVRGIKLSTPERLALLAQLSVLLDSGIQVHAALKSMREQSENPRITEILAHMEDTVENGEPLSVAVASLPKAFPRLIRQMIEAGEKSGLMSEMIQRVNAMMEAQAELKGKVRSALLYPCIMVVVAVGVVVFLLTTIVPRFSDLFRGKESALPGSTKLLLIMGDFFSAHWFWVFPLTLGLFGGVIVFLRTAQGAPILDRMLLKIPVMGDIYRTAILARTASTIGMLTEAGIPILAALKQAVSLAGSPSFQDLWSHVHDQVENGASITEAIRTTRLIPPTFKQVVSAGESTGSLDEVLIKISKHYADEIQRRVRDLSTIIEPTLVVMMGGVVGFIAMSIMLPIFRLSRGV